MLLGLQGTAARRGDALRERHAETEPLVGIRKWSVCTVGTAAATCKLEG